MEGFVNEYLTLIGAKRDDNLEALIDKHLKAFFYCNVWLWHEGKKPVNEREVLASDNVLQVWEDIKRDGFGYCFQQIEVQKAVLDFLGHATTRHASMPVNAKSGSFDEQSLIGRHCSHEILIHTKSGGIVDVGYAANALTTVLHCPIGSEAKAGDNTYRVTQIDSEWRQLEVLLPAGWWTLYRFQIKPTDYVKPLAEGTLLEPQPIRIRDDVIFISKVYTGKRKWLQTIVSEGKLGALWKVIVDGKPFEEKWIEKWEDVQTLAVEEFGRKLDDRLRPLFA